MSGDNLLDLAEKHPLAPANMYAQPTMSIGIFGSVEDFRSAVSKAVPNVQIIMLEDDSLKRIHCTNLKIYKSEGGAYSAYGSWCDVPDSMTLTRHICLIDGPVESLATTFIGGTIIDTALLIIPANASRQQISDYISALDATDFGIVLILHICDDDDDLVQGNMIPIKDLVRGTVAEGAPVLKISSVLDSVIGAVCQYAVEEIPFPGRSSVGPAYMVIIQPSLFRPESEAGEVLRGVVRGGLLKGCLKAEQLIEVRPGIINYDEAGKNVRSCTPVHMRVVSLWADQEGLHFALPGGFINVRLQTSMGAFLNSKQVSVRIVGEIGSLPAIYIQLKVKWILPKTTEIGAEIPKLVKNEVVKLTIACRPVGARVISGRDDCVLLLLTSPVCVEVGDVVAVGRKGTVWRLCGWGKILAGETLPTEEPVPEGLPDPAEGAGPQRLPDDRAVP